MFFHRQIVWQTFFVYGGQPDIYIKFFSNLPLLLLKLLCCLSSASSGLFFSLEVLQRRLPDEICFVLFFLVYSFGLGVTSALEVLTEFKSDSCVVRLFSPCSFSAYWQFSSFSRSELGIDTTIFPPFVSFSCGILGFFLRNSPSELGVFMSSAE